MERNNPETNGDISPVITQSIKNMEIWIEGLKITVNGGMVRTEPNEFYTLGQLGVHTTVELEHIGKKNVFLPYQIFEDMLTPYGHLIAQDVVYPLFKEEFQALKEKFAIDGK